jgi:hypothetical protein
MGKDPSAIDAALVRELDKIPKVSGGGSESMYTSRRLQQLLLDAEKKAEQMKDEYVSVEHFYLAFLDENNLPLLTTAFTGDQTIFPAPVVPFEGHPGCYRAEGSTPSQFRMKLTLANLKQLGNCRKIAYTVVLNTALSNPPDFVAVREDDRIAIRSYAVISPHANFTIPVTLPEIPFFSK